MSQREHIIAQAAKMFAEQGIKAIRMDDIAQSLGVSKRTLYELFADKEELLYLCVSHLHQANIAEFERQCSQYDDKIEAMFVGIRVMLDSDERHSRMMRNLHKFYPAVFERVRSEQTRDGLARLHKMILSLIEAGLIERDVNVELSVTIFYYTVTGVFFQRDNIVLPDGVTQKDAFMYTIVNFVRGIATVEGVSRIDALKAKYELEV